MELKAELMKPYQEIQKLHFISENNHIKGYEIKETETALQAWGYSESELLEILKKEKYAEACAKAYNYLNNGEGLYEFKAGKHIEATGDNFAKLTPYLIQLFYQEVMQGGTDKILENFLKLISGEISDKTVQWTTKEDEVVELNIIDVVKILQGIGQIQSYVWGKKFPEYKQAIEQSQTVEDVENIEINYGG